MKGFKKGLLCFSWMMIRYAIAHIHRLNRPSRGASKDVGMKGRDESWLLGV